jgi:hypothetical protein
VSCMFAACSLVGTEQRVFGQNIYLHWLQEIRGEELLEARRGGGWLVRVGQFQGRGFSHTLVLCTESRNCPALGIALPYLTAGRSKNNGCLKHVHCSVRDIWGKLYHDDDEDDDNVKNSN